MLGKIGRSWGMAGFSGCLWEMSWGRANVNTGEGEEKAAPAGIRSGTSPVRLNRFSQPDGYFLFSFCAQKSKSCLIET
ncbi:hypothetical protein RUM43_003338 [Polyplax serrata]|uniref:Uncharacterized protein n=1 Tax=Polyplax serrata TaxID=468196 RepID=A0AAN8P226_POLSC